MNSKEPKIPKTLDDDEDRFSALPDALLCHILSFLPTKYAVATTILSIRWKHLFAWVPNIDLDDSLFLQPQDMSPNGVHRFVKFVYRLLLLRNAAHIHRFRLKCGIQYEDTDINVWIRAVLWGNVRELDISLAMEESGTLPHDIFTCKTLERLKIDAIFRGVFCRISRVFSGCPVLEDLRLYKCILDNIQVVDISIPSLKKLTMHHCYGEYRIVVDTPNLEYFEHGAFGVGGYLVKNMESVVRASIDCGFALEELREINLFVSQNVAKLVNGLHNVKSLTLKDSSLEALSFPGCSLPTFRNLTLLKLGVSHFCGWQLLPDLLESSPNLEMLVFDEGFIDYSGVKMEFEYRLPESVPSCLSRHLREIKIGDFDGQVCEFKLVEYFLKSGEVLKKMIIGSEESTGWLLSTSKRLSAFPKCSNDCQIVLAWKKDGKSQRTILN